MTYANPHYLVEVEELERLLDDANTRVFDAAVHLKPQGTGGYVADSGRATYESGHIPGAGFIDLIEHWADASTSLRFTVPTIEALAGAIGESGISNDHRVVLYSSGHLMWATRAWWLLHYAGHDNIAILNGNLTAWRDAGLAIETGPASYPAATFTPHERPTRIASTDDMIEGMDGKVCTINALSRSLYEGTGDFYYQRRGHIPGSKLLYYDAVLDHEFFLKPEALEAALEAEGMLSAPRVVTYCGGGIAATIDAFACLLLGHTNVGVYDGSMSEWVLDDARPLTVGAEP